MPPFLVLLSSSRQVCSRRLLRGGVPKGAARREGRFGGAWAKEGREEKKRMRGDERLYYVRPRGRGRAAGEEKEDTYLQCVSVCTLSLVHDVATLFIQALCRFSKRSCCLKLNAAAVYFLWKLPTFFGNDKKNM